jgi:hypothetical protein
MDRIEDEKSNRELRDIPKIFGSHLIPEFGRSANINR